MAGIEKAKRKRELKNNSKILESIYIPPTMEPLYGLITYALTILDRNQENNYNDIKQD